VRSYWKLFFRLFLLFLPVQTWAELQPVYSPHGTELIYPGILQNTTTLGHYGVALNGRIGTQRNDSSAFALAGSFPLSFRFKEDDRNSGWAFGFAAGISEYVYEPQLLLSPGLYFWEFMIGRGSNHSDRNIRTGLLGFFEVTIKDERPNTKGDQAKVLSDHNRIVEEHRYSLNFRMGTSFSPLGDGLVRQKAGRFSSSLFFNASLPLQNDELRGSIHYQGLFKTWRNLITIFDLGVFGSYSTNRTLDEADDLKSLIFWGPRLEYRFSRQSFSLGAQWKHFQGAREHHFKAFPSINSVYQLAF